jgi:hypothetical protein
MKKSSRLTISAIAMLASVSVWANSNAHETDEPETSMMEEGEDSVMMEQGMSQKRITTGDRHRQHHEGSMMGADGHSMMMDPHMMHMMMGNYQMGQHQQQNMSSMGGNKGGMMNPEMMQNRQQHMENIELSLANIEALLTRLIEQQKP